MSLIPSQIRALQALTIGLLVFPLLVAGYWVYDFHQRTQADIEAMTPRIARLEGMAAQQQVFEDHAQLARNLINVYAWPANVEQTRQANELQERIRTAIEQTGLKIEGLQAKDLGLQDGYQRTRISLRFDGNLLQLQEALLALRGITPTLVHERLTIKNEGPLRPAAMQRLTGSMDILVLKAAA